MFDRLGGRSSLAVLQKQHVGIPKALLQAVAEDFLVVTLLLLSHDGVERQFLVSFVNATHCVVVVENDVWFLDVLSAFRFHTGRHSVMNGAQKMCLSSLSIVMQASSLSATLSPHPFQLVSREVWW